MADFIAKMPTQMRRILGYMLRPFGFSRHPRLTLSPNGSRANTVAFISWLFTGLADGSIAYNKSDAFVHFVEEGMLLQSPKAIFAYLEKYECLRSVNSRKPLIAMQRELQKSGNLVFNKDAKTYFHQYLVKQEEKDRKRSKKLTCYLIPNRRFNAEFMPPLNITLEKCAPVLLFPSSKVAYDQE